MVLSRCLSGGTGDSVLINCLCSSRNLCTRKSLKSFLCILLHTTPTPDDFFIHNFPAKTKIKTHVTFSARLNLIRIPSKITNNFPVMYSGTFYVYYNLRQMEFLRPLFDKMSVKSFFTCETSSK